MEFFTAQCRDGDGFCFAVTTTPTALTAAPLGVFFVALDSHDEDKLGKFYRGGAWFNE